VHTRVLNGSGRAGEANAARDDLVAVGFNTADASNASVELDTTTVRYAEGQRAKAELLARYLETPPNLVEDPTVRTVDVVLVTGLDYAGVLAAPQAPSGPVDPATPPTTLVPAPDVDAAAGVSRRAQFRTRPPARQAGGCRRDRPGDADVEAPGPGRGRVGGADGPGGGVPP
jgi:hypothetical protein